MDIKDFVTGGLAAGCAGIFTNPFDVLKTRMQLQGELKAKGQHAVHYRNVFHAAVVVVKNDGIFGLQKGLLPAISLHSLRNSVRLGLYTTAVNNGLVTDENGKSIFWRSFVAGSICGAAGAFCGSPLFLVKTQLQTQAAEKIAVGYQHHHTGTFSAIKSIYNHHGVRGLWRGSTGTVVRAIAGSSAQLTSFVMVKDALSEIRVLKNSPYLTSFIASVVGGIFQTIALQPFDLISTRLYNQGVDASGKGLLYKGVIDCCMKVWRTEGFFGFYKGVGAQYMRLAPHSALCLVFWDYFKDLQKNYFGERQIVIAQKQTSYSS